MKKIKTFTLLMIGVLILSSCKKEPVAPDNYQSSTRTGGVIEARYMDNGPYAVSKHENTVLQEFEKFIVYYPSELERGNQTWPVIVLCNGSGTPLSRYPAVAKHFASWGFIVVGTEENYSWNAFGAEMSIRYMERWNENETIEDTRSIFYHKVDFGNVGIVGHSQGGIGVFNAITETQHKDVYKTAVSLSPTNMELAHNLMWDYDVTKVEIPIMLMSGEGGGDDWVLTLDQLQSIYNDITCSKMMMRRVETVHNEMLYMPNGYVMAWFMWQLQSDAEAAKAFIGNAPEVLSNPLYVNQQIDLE